MSEEMITIDDAEMVEFINGELHKQGINISNETVLRVLDLEMEFLKSKGIAE